MDSHARGSSSLRSAVSALAVLLCAVTLAACTTDGDAMPVPEQTATSPQPTSKPETPAPSAPVAAVTIASIDVDGLNATVGGLVTDTSEDGGQCRFVLTKVADGTQLTADTVGIANVRSTSCGTAQLSVDQFTKGTWSVVLDYTSAGLTLQSEPLTMEIP